MNKTKRYLITSAFIVLIVAAIVLLESMKSQENLKYNKQRQKNVELKLGKYPKAPEIAGTQNWINSKPLKIEELKGKVVLIDFWTYTCINCIRTLPYLKDWDEKYRDKGLVIIGVHTPEFEFEKKYENVLKAVKEYSIKYPVVQDNDYAAWNAYENRYWPHKFLIDIDGFIRYDHIGEGFYEETEKMIQRLLNERMESLSKNININLTEVNTDNSSYSDYSNIKTPEIYFGYQFSRGNFGNPEGLRPEQTTSYKIPDSAKANNVYLSGEWKNNKDDMELVGDEGEVLLIFSAKKVNIVAGSENGTDVFISLDNDYENKSVSKIKEFKIYNMGSAENAGTHVLHLDVVGKGFKIYTFTFG